MEYVPDHYREMVFFLVSRNLTLPCVLVRQLTVFDRDFGLRYECSQRIYRELEEKYFNGIIYSLAHVMIIQLRDRLLQTKSM